MGVHLQIEGLVGIWVYQAGLLHTSLHILESIHLNEEFRQFHPNVSLNRQIKNNFYANLPANGMRNS